MKPTQNHKQKTIKPFNFKHYAVFSLMALNTFGHKALTFFDKLLTIGCSPFENLNRGQIKKMYWLAYL